MATTVLEAKWTDIQANRMVDEEGVRETPVKIIIMPSAPDGGWSWVVLGSCTYLFGMIVGTYSIFSVFLPQLLEVYQSDRATTAIIGSLLSALQLMLGPLVAAFISHFGCRMSAMLGSLLITTGLVLSTFAPSVQILIVTFGIIPGIGLGFIALPSVVTVGFYFDKRRSLAMGIVATGAGPAMIAVAPLAGVLLEHYNWKSALILLSGLTLQGVICGALLRPVNLTNKFTVSDDTDYIASSDNDAPESVFLTHHSNPEICPAFTRRNRSLDSSDTKIFVDHRWQQQDAMEKHNKAKNATRFSSLPEMNFSRGPLSLSPQLRIDVYNSGSIHHLCGNKTMVSCKYTETAETCLKWKSYICKDNFLQIAKSMVPLSILRKSSFWLIWAAVFLWQGGFLLCVYFITDYGISNGIEPQRASYLVLAFGVGTTIGRLAGGIICSFSCIRTEYITTVGLLFSGLSSGSIASFCGDFPSLITCSGLAGLFIAPMLPLTTVMLVEYLGLENLTYAQGMCFLGQGLGSLFSTPLAGLLQDILGSLSPPFYIAGVMFTLAGLLHLWLLISIKRRT